MLASWHEDDDMTKNYRQPAFNSELGSRKLPLSASSKICKSTIFLKNGRFDTLNTIPDSPPIQKNQPLFSVFLVTHAYSIIIDTTPAYLI